MKPNKETERVKSNFTKQANETCTGKAVQGVNGKKRKRERKEEGLH